MPLDRIINAALKFLEVRLNQLGDRIEKAISSSDSIDSQSRLLSAAILRIEKAIDKIKDPTFSGEVTVDTSSLEVELAGIAKQLKSVKPLDLNNIEKLLAQMAKGIASISLAETNEKLSALGQGMEGMQPPKTLKLDEMQFRALAAERGGAMAVNPGPMMARNVALTNLALTATNTQYPFVFPANTCSWQIKLRDQGTLAYYSFTTGTLPVVGGGGDASKYATIPQNFVRSQDGVDWSGKTIYLGSESASQVAEIEVYTM